MKVGSITFLSGMSLLVVASFATLLHGTPIEYAPLPGLIVIPTFLIGVPAIFVPTVFFFAWNRGLLKGSGTIPKRTYVFFVVAAALTVAWFVAGWNFGLQYQGKAYVFTVLAINTVWIVLLAFLLVRFWKRESFAWNLAIHWLLFAWLAWFAFPYLGELP